MIIMSMAILLLTWTKRGLSTLPHEKKHKTLLSNLFWGSNWIPAHVFQESITEEYVEWLIKSAKMANMNVLRVWGGGVYESLAFYTLADQYGIMIWQDFMFACSTYPTNRDYLFNVESEVTYQVNRLRNHPSIILWAGKYSKCYTKLETIISLFRYFKVTMRMRLP